MRLRVLATRRRFASPLSADVRSQYDEIQHVAINHRSRDAIRVCRARRE
jgi:hypothetical protein